METLVAQLLESPQANLLIREAQTLLAHEAQRREGFYAQITEQEKVEFINGEVLYHSPVTKKHNVVTGLVFRLLSTHVDRSGLGFVGVEKVMIALTRNDYEPDICFFAKAVADQFTDRQMQFPAPDLVVEVLSTSTEKVDRGVKFVDYAAHGTREYWLLDPQTDTLEQFTLVDSHFELLTKARQGLLQSHVLPQFVVPIEALFDEATNVRALQTLLSQG